MSNFYNRPFNIKFKQGLSINITATATVNAAVKGEPHWATDTNQLYVFDGIQNKRIVSEATRIPTSSSDSIGSEGDVAYDDNYVYYKTSLGWKRAALSTF